MLMNAARSTLLIIDIQSRLAPAIADGERVIEHCVWLAKLAERVGVPTVVTEHFPDKIGATVEALQAATGTARYVRKECFSAQAEGRLAGTAVEARPQVVVCGTEAHVCVLQTALELRWAGKEVFVVAEASASRDPANRDLAFARMRAHGIEIVAREMVAFEWLQRGGTQLFSAINREFIR
ncbi:isochorismatase family protein [Pseudothauera nasutitermitis]|uniref:Isochorismatase family protein n=1 Tax=Pseudothauera nasutitermitis TaxID=2565930 RepID=A0A4S4B384_9RHOO|nr:isochorismatase family protein [Pseudothauera nasutitermitis]THF67120.1 isochorismatase family protein [Pseudothauera nasutitermitis]